MKKTIHKTWAEINIDNIVNNINVISAYLEKGTKIIAVVKADAYGHGTHPIVEAINDKVDMFAVSCIDEALQIRDYNKDKPILILGYTPPECATLLIEKDITQTVFSYDYAKELYSNIKTGMLKIHIKLDTGMSRLGFRIDEISQIKNAHADFSNKISFDGAFTHFAISGIKENPFTKEQFSQYEMTINELEKSGIIFKMKHVCNSAAIINFPQMHLDAVRPGIILYGMYPEENMPKIGILPALEFKTIIAQVHTIKKGTTVSYDRTFTATKNMKIATIPVGYADGFLRLFSNKGEVCVCGKRAKIIGRVCMDQSIIDITDIENVNIGTEVTLIGKDLPAEEVAKAADTINYELVCLLGKRVPRYYFKNGKVTKLITQASMEQNRIGVD